MVGLKTDDALEQDGRWKNRRREMRITWRQEQVRCCITRVDQQLGDGSCRLGTKISSKSSNRGGEGETGSKLQLVQVATRRFKRATSTYQRFDLHEGGGGCRGAGGRQEAADAGGRIEISTPYTGDKFDKGCLLEPLTQYRIYALGA